MADANKTLITRAEVTSLISTTTKRTALVLDGQTVELGSTGWRDASAYLQSVGTIVAGMLVVIRTGSVVTIKINVTPSVSGNVQITLTGLGSGFAPDTALFDQGRGGAVGVSTAGHVYINPAVAGTAVSGLLTFVTDNAWPSSLPGVELGQPVVV
jgi:hypothetical protein